MTTPRAQDGHRTPHRRATARIVLQARMGSSRLPGKALARIAGQSLLAHCIERLTAARVGAVVVATTHRPEDESIVSEARRLGVGVVRGAVDDVLGRFVEAIADFDGPYVFRATADNPLVDVDGPARLLAALESGADYCIEEGLPIGAAVEGIRTEVLREAAALAESPYDREHVTPFVRQRPDRYVLRALRAPLPVRRPSLRLTVDTRHDLQFVRSLMDHAGPGHTLLPLADVIALADRSALWAGVA